MKGHGMNLNGGHLWVQNLEYVDTRTSVVIISPLIDVLSQLSDVDVSRISEILDRYAYFKI
jgi:hypothetical protein